MKETYRLLQFTFWGFIAATLLLIILFETGILYSGAFAFDDYKKAEFVLQMVFELFSLAAAFFALRLFKFRRVHEELICDNYLGLMKWGVFRLFLLGFPMFFNTMLYYDFMNPTFGYLAIIMLLCMPFVYPTYKRCVAEVAEDEDSSYDDDFTDEEK